MSTTANRKIGLKFFIRLRRIAKKVLKSVFPPTANYEKNALFFSRLRRLKRPQQKKRLWRKRLRAQNRMLRCAQPASRRLLRKTAILTQMLRQYNSVAANQCHDMNPFFRAALSFRGQITRELASGFVPACTSTGCDTIF